MEMGIERYMSSIPQYSYHLAENSEAKLRVTFTAMHGVGAYYVTKAFAYVNHHSLKHVLALIVDMVRCSAFNLPPYIPVKEQVVPDPEFPTVAFPNPEEGKGALV
jgi:phosphomannomutase